MEGYSGSMALKRNTELEAPSLDVFYQTISDRADVKWTLREIMTTGNVDEIISYIVNGTAVGMNDGSFKGNFGTASWLIENAKGTQ